MARMYAKYMGIAIVLIGVVGLILGNQDFIGLNIDLLEDFIHLGTGGLMAYVGVAGTDNAVKTVVGGLGIVYLLVGVVGFFIPDLFGLLPHEYSTFDNLLHLTLGALGIGFAMTIKSMPKLPEAQHH